MVPKFVKLIASTLMMQLGWTTCLFGMPFIYAATGVSDTCVGMFLGFQLGGYILTCLAIRMFGDRLKPTHLIRYGSIFTMIVCFGLIALILTGPQNISITLLSVLLVTAGPCYGLTMGLYWPNIIALVLEDVQGQQLNKRLGYFNVCISVGAILGPSLGQILVQFDPLYPLVTAAGFFLLSVIFVLSYGKSLKTASYASYRREMPAEEALDPIQPKSSEILKHIRWIARIALITVFFCGGLRVQMGLLFKYEFGIPESVIGLITLAGNLTGTAVYLAMSRTKIWHYRLWLFGLVAILMFASTGVILAGCKLHFLIAASVGYGACGAIVYCTHLFYYAEKTKKKLMPISTHEITQASGTMAGSLIGGAISTHYGRISPFHLAIAVIVVGLVLQIFVAKKIRPNKK